VSLLLLDTHLLLWSTIAPRRLSASLRAMLLDPSNSLAFSVASIWEVAIKFSLGRDDFRVDPRRLREGLIDSGYREFQITSEHAIAVGRLPTIHRDPFDRILVAQAETEGALLLTVDPRLARSSGPIQLMA